MALRRLGEAFEESAWTKARRRVNDPSSLRRGQRPSITMAISRPFRSFVRPSLSSSFPLVVARFAFALADWKVLGRVARAKEPRNQGEYTFLRQTPTFLRLPDVGSVTARRFCLLSIQTRSTVNAESDSMEFECRNSFVLVLLYRRRLYICRASRRGFDFERIANLVGKRENHLEKGETHARAIQFPNIYIYNIFSVHPESIKYQVSVYQ